ncbi:MAG: nucleoside triphosphate pyrophosphohydrolase [Chlorobi bacterium]|nr:nucleoside triphosphate pyrophosphohydrolase [Chlorobiota bacterium]
MGRKLLNDLPPKEVDLKDATTLEEAIKRIYTITRRLRRECPWDREQTFDSIRHLTIEEVFELSDAIIKKDWEAIQEELGDVLLHVMFYSVMGEEQEKFNIVDVINKLSNKLIERHPHVYGNLTVENATQVKQNWEKIKNKKSERKSVLDGVPNSMPSLIKAYRLQEKAAQYGFDWNNISNVKEKVKEELKELEKAETQEEKEKEFGDLLFALVNYARHMGINPDTALELANKKFKQRFQKIEEEAKKRNVSLEQMTLEEMDQVWNKAKESER